MELDWISIRVTYPPRYHPRFRRLWVLTVGPALRNTMVGRYSCRDREFEPGASWIWESGLIHSAMMFAQRWRREWALFPECSTVTSLELIFACCHGIEMLDRNWDVFQDRPASIKYLNWMLVYKNPRCFYKYTRQSREKQVLHIPTSIIRSVTPLHQLDDHENVQNYEMVGIVPGLFLHFWKHVDQGHARADPGFRGKGLRICGSCMKYVSPYLSCLYIYSVKKKIYFFSSLFIYYLVHFC